MYEFMYVCTYVCMSRSKELSFLVNLACVLACKYKNCMYVCMCTKNITLKAFIFKKFID